MKMNKEQFLKTEFGGELESTITAYRITSTWIMVESS